MNPLLCLRVGYMERYDGPDTITSGGGFVRERGVGGEVYNFKPSRGRCYGYAMSLGFAGVRLGVLDPSRAWAPGDELGGVDVVFIARRPGHGQVVVGWYRDATVFHRQYRVRHGQIAGMDEPARQYLCVVDSKDAKLLPEQARTFPVPSAQTGLKGFPGQSNVWYPSHHLDHPDVKTFVARLRKYIASTHGGPLPADERGGKVKAKGRPRGADAAHNSAVERAAVDAAWAHLKERGFKVKSVESDNVGWDLEARMGHRMLRVEVKGLSGDTVNFELTPNEFAKLKQHAADYRVCVALCALDTPRLFDLAPRFEDGKWVLVSQGEDAMRVLLTERVAAVGMEVAA